MSKDYVKSMENEDIGSLPSYESEAVNEEGILQTTESPIGQDTTQRWKEVMINGTLKRIWIP